MEEGAPVFESFTESVVDGPSQPLMRKLVSLMSDTSPVIAGASDGFLLVDPSLSPPLAASSSSRLYGSDDVVEDIAQTAGCPVEDFENTVQSGFRFAGSEGCCNVPSSVENYFTESQPEIPADLADKVPIDLLHAINNVLVPMPKLADILHHDHNHGHDHGHHHHHGRRHGRRRGGKRAGPPHLEPRSKKVDEDQQGGGDGSTAAIRDCRYAQEMVTRRLDRLEEICLRTESYVQMVLGTMDRRLQLLEGEAVARCTHDSMTSPRFPAAALSTEAGTFVTPEMLMLQSPRPDRMSLAAAATAAATVAPVAAALELIRCRIPEEPETTPASFSAPVPNLSEQPEYGYCTAAAEDRSEAEARDEIPESIAPATPEAVDEIATTYRQTSERPMVTAVAVFSLAPDAAVAVPSEVSPADALLNEPVVTWESEGFPYLRPAYRVEFEPRPRDTTVLTWDAVCDLTPASSSSEDDRITLSSDNAFAFCNVEDEPVRQDLRWIDRKEESQVLNEVSVILQSLCTELESYSVPEDGPGSCRMNSESCPHCGSSRRSGPANEEEIVAVLEEMFTRLSFYPNPEDVLVSILPAAGEDSAAAKPKPAAKTGADHPGQTGQRIVIEGLQYAPLPQHEYVDEMSSTKAERSFEIFPLDAAAGPRMALSFSQDGGAASEVRQSVQGIQVTNNGPPSIHVAIAPKEVKPEEPSSEGSSSSVVQEIRFAVGGSYTEPVACKQDVGVKQDAVPIASDKLQLSSDVVADYTLKVVPRPDHDQQAAAGSGVIPLENKTMINEDEVRAVIHELCFGLDVPSASAQQEQEVPMQITIALTGSGAAGIAPSIVGSGSSSQQQEIATVVLDLEPLQKLQEQQEPTEARAMAFNWEGVPVSTECQDIPCLLRSEDRQSDAEDGITSIHQDICICLEVPTSRGDEAGGVQIGIDVKSVPRRDGTYDDDDAAASAIDTLEIPADRQFEKAPLTEPAPLGIHVVPASNEELEPLTRPVEEDHFIALPPSRVEDAAPEAHEFVIKEEKKTEEEEWVIDSSFLPREIVQKPGPRVPKPILKGVSARDLIRGSLHFDGKTCLLSVSMDDIWTPDEMCQAPVPAAKLEKPSPRSAAAAETVIREMPAWLGDALIDEIKPAAAKAFGFHSGSKQQQSQQPQPMEQQQQQQQRPIQRQVLGFRSSPGKQGKQAPQQPGQEPVFGFRSLPSKTGKPPLPTPATKPSISVTVPVSSDAFADWDSSLSLVARGRQAQLQQEQPDLTKPRVPDSPGARSCIINKASGVGIGSGAGSISSSALVVEAESEQDSQAAPKAIISDAASGSTPTQTSPASTLILTVHRPTPPAKTSTALDLLDAGGGGGGVEAAVEARESSDALHVLAVDEDTFFDALECSVSTRSSASISGSSSGNNKIKRYLKDKLWNKFSCYGTGLPDSDSSDALPVPCPYHRRE